MQVVDVTQIVPKTPQAFFVGDMFVNPVFNGSQLRLEIDRSSGGETETWVLDHADAAELLAILVDFISRQ